LLEEYRLDQPALLVVKIAIGREQAIPEEVMETRGKGVLGEIADMLDQHIMDMLGAKEHHDWLPTDEDRSHIAICSLYSRDKAQGIALELESVANKG
jgi:hypothetical protein